MAFQRKHKKLGGRKPGTKNKKTLVAESIGITNIEGFRTMCLDNLYYFLSHSNDMIRYSATKEILKYIFPKCNYDYGFDPGSPEESPY